MRYYLPSDDLYIEIKASVFNQIKLQAEGEYPNENGGMLAGRQTYGIYRKGCCARREADRQNNVYAQYQWIRKDLETISQRRVALRGRVA